MDAAAERPSDVDAVTDRYARFARDEAPGRSALYEEWAAGVAAAPEIAAVLARIPAQHRQPPLVFAVSRLLGAPETDFPAWSEWVGAHADDLVDECTSRSLQTNEPLRCAALLPALSLIDGPLALIELGASAGLCLYPDRYSYRYLGGPSIDPGDGVSEVVLRSELRGAHPELRMPQIVWRAGIDLAPLDARDEGDRRFLTALVWPGETGRVERIERALAIAASDPPVTIRGDATEPGVLTDVIAQAPAGATVVITTPGVLPHVPWAGRERLFAHLATTDAVWITIDPPGLHDQWRPAVDAASWGGFVLGVDGVPVAAVDPLGEFVEWRADAAPIRR